LKKLTVLVFLILLFGIISACSNDKPTNSVAGDSSRIMGDNVFQKSCITCHSSGDISGGNIMIDNAKIHKDFKNEKDLVNFVQTNMPKSAPGSLTKKEYEAVAAYLWEQKQ
jgi:mono/diheme cytochrome c family protein